MPYEQIDELSKVLRYSSLNFSVEEKIQVYKIISELDRIVAVIPKRKTRRGAVDDILLDAAEQFDVQYVVTGDEGLLAQHYAGNAKIVTPEAFLQSEC